jgi:hypothetical protein
VGVQIPQLMTGSRTRRRSAKLKQVASFYREGIRANVLASSQFPATLTDKAGTFTKPASW